MLLINPKLASEIPYAIEVFAEKSKYDTYLVVETENCVLKFKGKEGKFNVLPFDQMVGKDTDAKVSIIIDFDDSKVTSFTSPARFDKNIKTGFKDITPKQDPNAEEIIDVPVSSLYKQVIDKNRKATRNERDQEGAQIRAVKDKLGNDAATELFNIAAKHNKPADKEMFDVNLEEFINHVSKYDDEKLNDILGSMTKFITFANQAQK